MLIKSLTLKGLRGFSGEECLRFAQPSDKEGSGLTILVGPNSGGKSTIVEAMGAFSRSESISFSGNMRNKQAGDRISVCIELDNGDRIELKTVEEGGSETKFEPATNQQRSNLYVLPSRRYFDPGFGKVRGIDRQTYSSLYGGVYMRGASINGFHTRLFHALQNREKFNEVLQKVMDPIPDWTIDLYDSGSFYVKVNSSGQDHTSEGIGEGIVSLLFIVDALYDSENGNVIVIDEPELSLHPAYQRRLLTLLAEYSKSIQIVYATHSPYFVDFTHLLNGAKIARVHKDNGGCKISQLSDKTVKSLNGLLKNRNNPHILGLNAREALFQEDGIVLVEGQDDVVYYTRLAKDFALPLEPRFFGWGTGGADNIKTISSLLYDLGFNKVAGILDADKKNLLPELQGQFENYRFYSIPANDVRTKKARTSKDTCGLFKEDDTLRPKFKEETEELFKRVENYISSQT